ncbi:hypothetical protein EVAR_53755_1 [Eumeta japonica]|uniref:Uncharacterized protein n=1 Tax=Eumeta variegata TaxID=151549 RepID=A0A4C1ZCR7_EUMVA|nr:hypothetical protein EVAR_53755_1 [Eumeta japonica]
MGTCVYILDGIFMSDRGIAIHYKAISQGDATRPATAQAPAGSRAVGRLCCDSLGDKFCDRRLYTSVNNKNIDAVRRTIETDTHVAYHVIRAYLSVVQLIIFNKSAVLIVVSAARVAHPRAPPGADFACSLAAAAASVSK